MNDIYFKDSMNRILKLLPFCMVLLLTAGLSCCSGSVNESSDMEPRIKRAFLRWNRQFGTDRGIRRINVEEIRNTCNYGMYTDPDFGLLKKRSEAIDSICVLTTYSAEVRSRLLDSARISLSMIHPLSSGDNDGNAILLGEWVEWLERIQGSISKETLAFFVEESIESAKRLELVSRGKGRIITISYCTRDNDSRVTKIFITPEDELLLYCLDGNLD